MQKLKYLFLLAVITLSTFFAALPSDVFASADDFSFKKFNADYYLTKNTDDSSEMQVTETLVAEFPNYNQNHGIERKIPFLNQDGTNLTMESPDELDIEVTRNGASEPYTVVAYSDYFLVRIGDPNVYVQGEQTYVLKYKFIHTITEFDASTYSLDAYQELYWDSNGTGWSQSFDEISVNLRMDKEIYKNLKSDLEVSKDATYYNKALIHQNNTTKHKLAAWCYVGRQGSSNQNRCDISDIANGINFSAKNLSRGENLTFVTNFNQDTFYVPKNKFIKKLYFSSATFDYYLSKNSDFYIFC